MPRKGPAPKRPLVVDPVYSSPVVTQLVNRVLQDGKKTVAWDFVYIPSEEWKKNLKQALIAYAADNTKWDGVKNAFVDGWKTEKAASE